MTEEEMVGWHHQLGGHESAQALGEGGGQGGLVSYSRWGHRESDTTWQLNNSNKSAVCSFDVGINRMTLTYLKTMQSRPQLLLLLLLILMPSLNLPVKPPVLFSL